MEDDLFEVLESKKAPDDFGNKNAKGNDRLWNTSEFDPVKIDQSKLVKINKSFTLAFAKNSGEVPDDKKMVMMKIAKGLIAKGFVFRHNGDADDAIQNLILATENVVTESYLPWRKFNSNIVKPVSIFPELLAFRIAANYHSKFSSMPPAVRAINANFVHSLLGKSCINPSTLLLCYSESGDVVVNKKTDYTKCRNLTFPLRVTEAAGIPVFNVATDDCLEKCVEFIKAID